MNIIQNSQMVNGYMKKYGKDMPNALDSFNRGDCLAFLVSVDRGKGVYETTCIFDFEKDMHSIDDENFAGYVRDSFEKGDQYGLFNNEGVGKC